MGFCLNTVSFWGTAVGMLIICAALKPAESLMKYLFVSPLRPDILERVRNRLNSFKLLPFPSNSSPKPFFQSNRLCTKIFNQILLFDTSCIKNKHSVSSLIKNYRVCWFKRSQNREITANVKLQHTRHSLHNTCRPNLLLLLEKWFAGRESSCVAWPWRASLDSMSMCRTEFSRNICRAVPSRLRNNLSILL